MKSNVEITWKGDEVKGLYADAVTEALWLAGHAVVTEAMNIIPLDTGTLRRSYAVTVGELPDGDKEYQRAKAGATPQAGEIPTRKGCVYISYNTPYAAFLHENLTWRPRKRKKLPSGRVVDKPAVGGPKWLEKSLSKGQGQIAKFLKIAVRKRGKP